MSHDHTFVSGEVLTAANLNDLSSGRVSYVAVTANQTGITTIADATSLTITFTAIASRYYRVTGYAYSWAGTSGTPVIAALYIADGSNNIIQECDTAVITNAGGSSVVQAIVSPGAGSITYKLRAAANTGTVTLQASSTRPAFILVEDLGSS
jgi:hypothetical protein